MRGPGMNKGLKKPRKQPVQPKPYTPSREAKKALQATETTSYLPSDSLAGLGKPRARKGKVLSSKLL